MGRRNPVLPQGRKIYETINPAPTEASICTSLVMRLQMLQQQNTKQHQQRIAWSPRLARLKPRQNPFERLSVKQILKVIQSMKRDMVRNHNGPQSQNQKNSYSAQTNGYS